MEIKNFEDCFKLKSGYGLTSKMMRSGGTYPVFGGNGIAGDAAEILGGVPRIRDLCIEFQKHLYEEKIA